LWVAGAYDPMTFPNCETQLISASATARFAGGYDTELLAQAKKQMKPPYDCAIKNLANAMLGPKYLYSQDPTHSEK